MAVCGDLQLTKFSVTFGVRGLPAPVHDEIDRELSPCSLHFIENGRALIGSYVYAGMICWDVETCTIKWRIPAETRIGRSALSPDHRSIVVCNLVDGFDRYRIDHQRRVQQYSVRLGENIPLPVCFIHDGDALLFGSACGDVSIVDEDDASLIQVLHHPGLLVLGNPAYIVVDGNVSYIATGTSERGKETKIRIWAKNPGAHMISLDDQVHL
ncbi:uncharacterized protein TRAVEDRAFT_131739 [Trametes versicolor FP-101664 SS1]|uniref:uncharacterized protein n=1 Tax=Trametes versicolor (strain FP-101664) TaxID=717944 RepID=UPI0004623939|nr:uncharacterized protein TRAVEDRAFT_131739 [Trametes versicolor FP-101664 SS1]EIW54899.1 hypothetical protein TRAVEDRAFT_131739 [Trametes versicolor FP-101664 SS1]